MLLRRNHPGRALANYPAAGSTVGPTLNGDRHPRPTLNGDEVGMRIFGYRGLRLDAREYGPVGREKGRGRDGERGKKHGIDEGRGTDDIDEGRGKDDIDEEGAAVDAGGEQNVLRPGINHSQTSATNAVAKQKSTDATANALARRLCVALTSSSIVVAAPLAVGASPLIVCSAPICPYLSFLA